MGVWRLNIEQVEEGFAAYRWKLSNRLIGCVVRGDHDAITSCPDEVHEQFGHWHASAASAEASANIVKGFLNSEFRDKPFETRSFYARHTSPS